jgi:hypothetical protein
MERTDRADRALTLFLTQAVGGLDVVDLGHRVPVDRDLKLPVRETEDGVDWHFEVGVLAFPANEQIVRVDLSDMAEQGAIEAHHRGPQRDVSGTVRIVSHSHLLCAGLTIC